LNLASVSLSQLTPFSNLGVPTLRVGEVPNALPVQIHRGRSLIHITAGGHERFENLSYIQLIFI
jgi:hypothetical protein